MHPTTYDQPLLFELAPLVEPEYGGTSSLAERFSAFHQSNPQVYAALRELALMMQGRGIRRWGIGAAFEVLRFRAAMQTNSLDYKLNNDFRAPYSRLLMEREPALAGFFEVRRSVADD